MKLSRRGIFGFLTGGMVAPFVPAIAAQPAGVGYLWVKRAQDVTFYATGSGKVIVKYDDNRNYTGKAIWLNRPSVGARVAQ